MTGTQLFHDMGVLKGFSHFSNKLPYLQCLQGDNKQGPGLNMHDSSLDCYANLIVKPYLNQSMIV